MIRLNDVGYIYPSTNKGISNISTEIPSRSITVLIGSNGSGKSTLLRCIAGLCAPSAGKITLLSEESGEEYPLAEMHVSARAKKIAFLTQTHEAPEGIRVKDLVRQGRQPHTRTGWVYSAEDRDMVDTAIEVMGLTRHGDRMLGSLSGGERQRAWIAMALAQNTEIILLDEPLTHLDIPHQWGLLEVLKSVCADRGKTIVTVMHDLNPAAAVADRIIGLKGGRLAAEGKPEVILNGSTLHSLFGIEFEIRSRKGCPRRPCVHVF